MSKILNVRLDERSQTALSAIQEQGSDTASEAVRRALVAFARELREKELALEAAELMADDDDRKEVAATRDFFGDAFDAAS